MNGKARRAIGKTATYVTLVIIILVLNLPFLSMLGTALKPSKDAMTVELFPSNPTFENFVNIFTNTNFPRYLLNSFIVAIVAMVLCTVFAATAGYVIASCQARNLFNRPMVFNILLAKKNEKLAAIQ